MSKRVDPRVRLNPSVASPPGAFNPYIIAAMIFLSKFKDPAGKLGELTKAAAPRIR